MNNVTITLDEYVGLLEKAMTLCVIEKVVKNMGEYQAIDLIKTILDVDKEGEDDD